MNSLSQIAVIYSSGDDTVNKIEIKNRKWECESAASCGDLERLKRARAAGCEWNVLTYLYAAKNGHLECLKYVHTNGCPTNIHATNESSEGGHIECLKYIHENGVKLHPDTCKKATRNGHLNCLKYAHKNGCILTNDIYNTIISSKCKSIECFKYLHENGCLWNEDICKNIVLFGNIDLLKYAYKNGCPWGENTCIHLFEKADIECIKYAYAHGCTWYEDYKIFTDIEITADIGKNDNKILECWDKKNIEIELHYNDYYYTPEKHQCIEGKWYDPFVTELLEDIQYLSYLSCVCTCCYEYDEDYINVVEKEKREETLKITLKMIN